MRRAAATAVPFFLALAIAACGEEEPEPRQRLQEAARALQDAGSAAYDAELRVRSAGDTGQAGFTVSSTGTYDHARGVGRFRLELGGSGMSLEVIRDTAAAYVRLPAIFTGGRQRWIRRSLPGGSEPVAGGSDRLARLLERYGGDVRRLGTETVDDRELDGFGLTLRGDRLWPDPDSLPDQLREGIEEMGESVRKVRDLEVPAEVWLDDGDRVRRLVLDIAMEPALAATRAAVDPATRSQIGALSAMLGSAPGDTLAITVRFSDFGTPVDPGLPEGADVVGLEEFREEMGLGGTAADSVPAGGGTGAGGR